MENDRLVNYGQLIEAMETICRSDEFKSLTPEHQVEFKDFADVVIEEASQSAPDVSKLKRWTEELKKNASS